MFVMINRLEAIASENILVRVITCDESWLFDYDPETKRQSMQWVDQGEARPKKARMSKLQLKQCLLHFLIRKAWFIKNFSPEDHNVCGAVFEHPPTSLWTNSSYSAWVVGKQLLVVPSRQRTRALCLKICDFFAKKEVNVLDHPTYSPDLAPCNFFLFSKIQNILKVIIFKVWRAFKKIRPPHLKALRKKSSVRASSNGNIAWRSAFSPR